MLGEIRLGERTFPLRRFTLRENAKAYPLARALVAAGVIDRYVAAMEDAVEALARVQKGERPGGAPGVWEVTEDEMVQIAELVFLACHAADPSLTREDFEAAPMSPRELFDAFFQARYCTGAWLKPDPADAPEVDPSGEDDGAAAPKPRRPKSTSGGSSPG